MRERGAPPQRAPVGKPDIRNLLDCVTSQRPTALQTLAGHPPPSSESASRELWPGAREAALGTCGDIDAETSNDRDLKD